MNGTHNTALLGACNKMFWSEYHKGFMELALDIQGMESQILPPRGERLELLDAREGLIDGREIASVACRRTRD